MSLFLPPLDVIWSFSNLTTGTQPGILRTLSGGKNSKNSRKYYNTPHPFSPTPRFFYTTTTKLIDFLITTFTLYQRLDRITVTISEPPGDHIWELKNLKKIPKIPTDILFDITFERVFYPGYFQSYIFFTNLTTFLAGNVRTSTFGYLCRFGCLFGGVKIWKNSQRCFQASSLYYPKNGFPNPTTFRVTIF